MIKKTITVLTGAILGISLLFSLCACSMENGRNNSENYDVIYSLYNCFKQEVTKMLSPDYIREQVPITELKEHANEINWIVSALLTSLDTLQEDTVIIESDKETAKESITEITSLIDEKIMSLYFTEIPSDYNETMIKISINYRQSILANYKYIIDLNFDSLDIILSDNMPSQNLISIDNLKTECVCEVVDYITVNDE